MSLIIFVLFVSFVDNCFFKVNRFNFPHPEFP